MEIKIETNANWQVFDKGNSIGRSGSEGGTIVYDIEHSAGARITLEQKTTIAPYATTVGVYGLMFHTRFDSVETTAKQFIAKTIERIDLLFEMLEVPKEKQEGAWKEKFNNLMQDLAEQ